MSTRTGFLAPPRTYWLPAFVQLLAVLIVSLPAVQWLANSESLWLVPFERLPRGQIAYLLSKLAALYAIALFAIQLAYGISGARARTQLGYEFGVRFHRMLGLTTLSLILTHAALFIVGARMRTGHFPMQFVLPNIFADYYVSRIALGWWAAVALIVATGCALVRARLGRWWRLAHWLSIPATSAVAVHSLSVGTESRMPLMLVEYGCMAVLLCMAVFLRIRTGNTTAAPSE